MKEFFIALRNASISIVWYSLLIFIGYLLVMYGPPFIFNYIYGEDVLTHTMTKYITNTTDPDKKALAIMEWEKQYFYNPYSLYNPNSTMQELGFYNTNEGYKFFGGRPAPASWIIYSKLANCGEYAQVFVAMMNNAGIESRLITAPGEDHAWAEYMHDGYRIAVDPSQNYVIGSHEKEFEGIMGVNFSYVIAIDSQGNKIDVSDEYIERRNLTIFVSNYKQPIDNTQVIIKNPYLLETRGGRYTRSFFVTSEPMGTEGNVSLKLGFQKYNVEVRVNHFFLLDTVYRKNATVDPYKENSLNFNLENDTNSLELFTTRYI